VRVSTTGRWIGGASLDDVLEFERGALRTWRRGRGGRRTPGSGSTRSRGGSRPGWTGSGRRRRRHSGRVAHVVERMKRRIQATYVLGPGRVVACAMAVRTASEQRRIRSWLDCADSATQAAVSGAFHCSSPSRGWLSFSLLKTGVWFGPPEARGWTTAQAGRASRSGVSSEASGTAP